MSDQKIIQSKKNNISRNLIQTNFIKNGDKYDIRKIVIPKKKDTLEIDIKNNNDIENIIIRNKEEYK